MKRSPMRRARKNRKRLKNDDLYEQYKEINGDKCEIAFWLGAVVGEDGLSFMLPGIIVNRTLNRHHIWSLGRRPDYWSNIIMVDADPCVPSMHSWFHRHLPESRVMSCLAKLRKMDELAVMLPEFTIAEIDAAAGKSAMGVIENYWFEDSRMRGWQAECIKRLKALNNPGHEKQAT